MNTIGIIQARMGSTRLPGKVLRNINGKPLLAYEIERLQQTMTIDQFVVATTTKETDNPIVDFCKEYGLSFYRGAEEDVLARYYEAAREFKANQIVRITSDCPLIDPKVVDTIVRTLENGKYDYVSNTLTRSYPRGMDAEIFTFEALEKAHLEAKKSFEREHVTPYFYFNPELFNIHEVMYKNDQSSHRWTVDTIEDLKLVEQILAAFSYESCEFYLEDILELMKSKPDLAMINSKVKQKKLQDDS